MVSSARAFALVLLASSVSACSADSAPSQPAPDAGQPPADPDGGVGPGKDKEAGPLPPKDGGEGGTKPPKDGSTDPGDASGGTTPVYFTSVSHNERTLTRFGSTRDSVDGYRTYRNSLVRVAQLLGTYGFKLSWQTDYVVLDGMEKYEATVLAEDPSKTNAKSVLVYLKEDLGASIEPHAHECVSPPSGNHCKDKPYNYADIVARIRAVGKVEPNPIIGGSSAAERTLDQWTSCIKGNVFPETWCPTALTVFSGASGGHEAGGDDFHSGAWRPTSLTGTEFITDNPSGKLAYIGSGYLFTTWGGASSGAYQPVSFVTALLAKLESGELPKGKLYTTSLMLVEDKIISEGHYDEIEGVLKELKPLVDQGKVVPATYPEVLNVWSTRYANTANIVGF